MSGCEAFYPAELSGQCCMYQLPITDQLQHSNQHLAPACSTDYDDLSLLTIGSSRLIQQCSTHVENVTVCIGLNVQFRV